jgi:hypothetical protein
MSEDGTMHNPVIALAVILLPLALAACQTRGGERAENRAQQLCAEGGYPPGTDAYDLCVQQRLERTKKSPGFGY